MNRSIALVSSTAALTAALLLVTGAQAASSASSASSEGSSASSGSVSDSFGSSSESSKTEKKVAQGDYRIVQIAAAAQPGQLRLVLEAVAGADAGTTGRFELTLPEATVQQAALAQGATVHARERSYGWAFAAGTLREGREPFFLVVHDAQKREFATTKLSG
jgi:hypothetical protein